VKDPLSHRLVGYKAGACGLRRGETEDQAQRKGDACFHREHRMARGEDEAQNVVPSSGLSSSVVTRASWASSSAMPISWVTRAMAAMSRVDSIFHTASIALSTSFMPARSGVPVLTEDLASSDYPVFKGPATL